MVIELVGYVGSILLAVCALPQAVACWKRGNGNGLDWVFLWCWVGGELALLCYAVSHGSVPLIINYGTNVVLLGVIMRYKAFPRGDDAGREAIS